MRRLRELALFAGAGGGLLGTMAFARPEIAVEINPFCHAILKLRQDEGHLDKFPIWDDIRTFDGTLWKNKLDLVSGGFPCQAFSTATHGVSTALDLWPEMLRIVREVEAPLVFAENVVERALTRAAEDCKTLGYKSLIMRLSGTDVGAPHRRNRFWMFAYTQAAGKILEILPSLSRIPKSSFWQTPPPGQIDNDPQHLNQGDNYLERNFGKGFRVHTPTGAVNYTAPCMQKHRSCRNWVQAFGDERPDPRVSEWLMN